MCQGDRRTLNFLKMHFFHTGFYEFFLFFFWIKILFKFYSNFFSISSKTYLGSDHISDDKNASQNGIEYFLQNLTTAQGSNFYLVFKLDPEILS